MVKVGKLKLLRLNVGRGVFYGLRENVSVGDVRSTKTLKMEKVSLTWEEWLVGVHLID